MKRIFTILVAVLLSATSWAQSPDNFSYQAVLRDAEGNIQADQDAATKKYVNALLQLLSQKGVIVVGIDGNIYATVRIGSQIWMAENLKTSKYNDGTDIPLVTSTTEWLSLSTPGYCWYYNDSNTYADSYGALYNGFAVNTGLLCPVGWHVPSDAEWTTLTDYLGGLSVAGGKLKETGTTHWMSPNTGATDEAGFTALPGGYRGIDGVFYEISYYGLWWTSTAMEEPIGIGR